MLSAESKFSHIQEALHERLLDPPLKDKTKVPPLSTPSNSAVDSLAWGKGIALHTKKKKNFAKSKWKKKKTDMTNALLQVHNGSYI